MNRTIAALATPPGTGGLAVIRISGDNAINIASDCFLPAGKLGNAMPNTIHYGKIHNGGTILDTVTASVFLAPHSYTGENTVEIGCHGGQLIADMILNTIYSSGATPAEPGEFTKRAFLNGKLDLAQVEAVADLIHSLSVPGVQTAARQLKGEFTKRLRELRRKLLDTAGLLELELDFSEEGLDLIDKSKIRENITSTIQFCNELTESYKSAEILRSGFFVAIAGYPNSGKSTLFNALLGRNRAIVSHIAGTTRDYIEETLMLNGLAIKFTDTAGIRETEDIIEIEGIKLVESVLEQANLILVLNDASNGFDNSDSLFENLQSGYPNTKILLLQNKIDLVDTEIRHNVLSISAITGAGINKLKELISDLAKNSTTRVSDILVNTRHANLLNEAKSSLETALGAMETFTENEIIAIDIRRATKILGELTGESWSEEVLEHIFSNFCIGK